MLVNGHEFSLLGVEPYTCKDGRETFLNVWHTHCGHAGCDQSWGFKTPAGPDPSPGLVWTPRGKCFVVHFCKKHRVKKPRKPHKPAALWKKMPSKKRFRLLSDEDVVRMRLVSHDLRTAGVSLVAVCEGLSVEYPNVAIRTICAIVTHRSRNTASAHPTPQPAGYPYNLQEKTPTLPDIG